MPGKLDLCIERLADAWEGHGRCGGGKTNAVDDDATTCAMAHARVPPATGHAAVYATRAYGAYALLFAGILHAPTAWDLHAPTASGANGHATCTAGRRAPKDGDEAGARAVLKLMEVIAGQNFATRPAT